MKNRPNFFTVFFFTVVAVVFTGYPVSGQVIVPDSILKTLKPQHPRLLVKSLQDFEAIKERSLKSPFLQKSIQNILANADSILTQPAVEYIFLDEQKYRMDTRQVHYNAYCLSMAYRLTSNKKYADKLWLNLEAASKFPDWNPVHFLDLATMTQAFAICYDWLYDIWTPKQRELLKRLIVSKGLMQVFLYYDHLTNKSTFDWSSISHNWSLVCNGGIGVGALAIADEEPVLAERILQEALKRIPDALQHFGPDGAYNEGPGYWGYAMRNIVPFLSSLETALGSDFGLTTIPGFSKAGTFFVSIGGANAMSFNYADAMPNSTRAPELFWLGTTFNQPLLTALQENSSTLKLQKGNWLQSPLELLWYRQNTGNVQNNTPLDNYYREAEVAAFRSNWTDSSAWFLACKAGQNGVNHGHLDIGSFILDKDGERWITDLGFENYNVPGYFGEINVSKGGKRWTYYRTRAEGHNTLSINPDKNEDQEIDALTKFVAFESTPKWAFGIMDITAAYAGKVTSSKRGFAIKDRDIIIIQDELVADSNMNIYWFAHTPATVTLSPNGKKAYLIINGKKIMAEITSPSNAAFQIMDPGPLPESPHPTVNNKNEGIKKLAIHLSNIKKVTVVVEFKGMDNNEKQLITPLQGWSKLEK